MQRIWIVSELYYPELTSTGYFLTCIAEGLAKDYDVSVLCGQPSYWERGSRAPDREVRNRVNVQRCWATTLDKNKTVFKLINLITISASIFITALFRLQPGDILIVVTTPPLLPYATCVACRLRRARLVLLIHDVYPEILTRLGMLKPQSNFIRLFDRASRWLYESASRIVVVGRDMKDLIAAKLRSHPERVVIATNWANLDDIVPETRAANKLLNTLKLTGRFVVQFWGNMGRPHNIEDLTSAAQLLSSDPDFHFLVIGWGTKRAWIENEKRVRSLDNLTILEPLSREETCNVQNACDVAINLLSTGMSGISVPSRSYNAMAAGKPLLAVCDLNSELAAMVSEEAIGWAVPPGRPDLIVSALKEAKSNPDLLRSMGDRARKAAETRYSVNHVLNVYHDLIEDLRSR